MKYKSFSRRSIICVVVFTILLAGNVKLLYNHYHFSNTTQPKKTKALSHWLNRQEIYKLLPLDSNSIVFIGDSETQNFPLSELFENKNIKNRGINGDLSVDLLNRLDYIIPAKPKKLFIQIGINDLLHGVSVDNVMINISTLVSRFRHESPMTLVYIQSVLPTTFQLDEYKINPSKSILHLNNRIIEYCKQNKIGFFDLYSSFQVNAALNPSYDCGDGLHLNGKGYLEWTKMIRDTVVKE